MKKLRMKDIIILTLILGGLAALLVYLNYRFISDWQKQENLSRNGVKLEAKILTKESSSSHRTKNYYFVISYTVPESGKTYKRKIKVDGSLYNMKSEGSNTSIFLDKRDPENIVIQLNEAAYFNFLLIVLIDLAILVYLLILLVKHSKS